MPISTLQQLELPLNTCVCEWSPHAACKHILAVGSYQLDESSQQRLGRLHLYAAAIAGATASEPPPLRELAALELPGVFDLRWHPCSAMPRLAAALADGSVRLLQFGEALAAGGAAAQLSSMELRGGEEPPEGMAVSLDYSRADGSAGEQLAVSYSSGQLQLFQAAPAGMASLATWQAHTLEAWAAATDHWHPSLLHSGGDDCAYRLWDTRQGFEAPAWQNSKAHGAGVCCVSSSPHQQHAVCTGSYDDRLRLWDLRAMHRPLLQAEVNLGGGVWRAKWHPTEAQLVLAACMYNGFAVVRVAADSQEIEVLQTYEHAPGSLSYGADWCRDAAACGSSSGSLAATATFYDKQLHLWSYSASA